MDDKGTAKSERGAVYTRERHRHTKFASRAAFDVPEHEHESQPSQRWPEAVRISGVAKVKAQPHSGVESGGDQSRDPISRHRNGEGEKSEHSQRGDRDS